MIIVDFMSYIVYSGITKTKCRLACFYRMEDGTEPAKDWLDALKDKAGLAKIFTRIRRAEKGNFGDHKKLVEGEGVSELRISFGPGYRVYYGIDNDCEIIILLIAGDKSSQRQDIKKAKEYWKDYKRRKNEQRNSI